MHFMYLGIDTATPILCLGLWREGFSETLELKVERDHAKRIIVELDTFLEQHKLKKHDLQGIGVGVGPGSYTGIRVAIATAKGLARGLTIPLAYSSSLSAMAHACLSEGQRGIVAIDARRDNLYYGIYEKQGSIVELLAPTKESREALKEKHKDLRFFEDVIPSASYLAEQSSKASLAQVSPFYL